MSDKIHLILMLVYCPLKEAGRTKKKRGRRGRGGGGKEEGGRGR
jgi:hypothetical protein